MGDSRRLLRRPAVLERIGLRTTELYDLMREERFPVPVPLGKRAVAWVEDEVAMVGDRDERAGCKPILQLFEEWAEPPPHGGKAIRSTEHVDEAEQGAQPGGQHEATLNVEGITDASQGLILVLPLNGRKDYSPRLHQIHLRGDQASSRVWPRYR